MKALGVRQRIKVQARLLLSRMLTVVPTRWAEHVRDRALEATGYRRLALERLVSVLRYRPFGSLPSFVVPGSPGVRLAAVDSRLTRFVYWYGENGYEQGEVVWWRRACQGSTSILELGANVGYYTVQGARAAGPDARYVAVDANPDAVEIIRSNVELNGLTNVTVVHGAVVGTKTHDTLTLALPDIERYRAPTLAYVPIGGEIVDRPASRSIQVPALTMVDLIDGVDLLKLDIEGFEHDVLSSVKAWLLSEQPTVFVELLYRTPLLRELVLELCSAGYAAYAIALPELEPLTMQDLRDFRSTTATKGASDIRDIVLVPSGGGRAWISAASHR